MIKSHFVYTVIVAVCLVLSYISNPCVAQEKKDSINTFKKDTVQHKIIEKNKLAVAQPALADTGELRDSIPPKPQPYQPNPKRAGLYSAILPGMGQVYNKQLWKVPIIYCALGVATYIFLDDLNNYQSFRKAYIGRINNPYPTDKYVNIYTQSQLQQLQNDYNKYMDMTVLYSVIGFTAQVIDAIASAHLKNFDISRDISLRMKPVVSPSGLGLGLAVNFK